MRYDCIKKSISFQKGVIVTYKIKGRKTQYNTNTFKHMYGEVEPLMF